MGQGGTRTWDGRDRDRDGTGTRDRAAARRVVLEAPKLVPDFFSTPEVASYVLLNFVRGLKRSARLCNPQPSEKPSKKYISA